MYLYCQCSRPRGIRTTDDHHCQSCGRFVKHTYPTEQELKDVKELNQKIQDEKNAKKTQIRSENYTIQNREDYPDGRKNIIWIENNEGEGMGVCLDELWEEKF